MYTTTVAGAYSIPAWYEAIQQAVTAGTLAESERMDAQSRVTQAALVDQEVAGVDVVTGGEMHRRHVAGTTPLEGMLNFFWSKLPGFARDAAGQLLTRPRLVTAKVPDLYHPAAVCVGRIRYDDLGLVDEFEFVASNARDPENVKVTVTGPHMLARMAVDEHYGSIEPMMRDLAEVLNSNLKALDRAGCRHIQIDEPLFAVSGIARREVEAAVDAVNQTLDGVRAFKWVHVCQGDYQMPPSHAATGQRYFDQEEYPADLICSIACDALMNEGDMTPRYEGYLRNQQLALGVADVQDRNAESAEVLAERIRALSEGWLPPEQTLITTSCGMSHLPRPIAFAKMKAMAGAKVLLRGQSSRARAS